MRRGWLSCLPALCTGAEEPADPAPSLLRSGGRGSGAGADIRTGRRYLTEDLPVAPSAVEIQPRGISADGNLVSFFALRC